MSNEDTSSRFPVIPITSDDRAFPNSASDGEDVLAELRRVDYLLKYRIAVVAELIILLNVTDHHNCAKQISEMGTDALLDMSQEEFTSFTKKYLSFIKEYLPPDLTNVDKFLANVRDKLEAEKVDDEVSASDCEDPASPSSLPPAPPIVREHQSRTSAAISLVMLSCIMALGIDARVNPFPTQVSTTSARTDTSGHTLTTTQNTLESAPVVNTLIPEGHADSNTDNADNNVTLDLHTPPTLWDALTSTDLPEDEVIKYKNDLVSRYADRVNPLAETKVALASLPSGYDAIQASSCASTDRVGEMLDCITNTFDASVANQVAGELVFNGFTSNPEDQALEDALGQVADIANGFMDASRNKNHAETNAKTMSYGGEASYNIGHEAGHEAVTMSTTQKGYIPDNPTDLPEPAFVRPADKPKSEVSVWDSISDETAESDESTEIEAEKDNPMDGEPVKVNKPSFEQRFILGAKKVFSRAKGWFKRK